MVIEGLTKRWNQDSAHARVLTSTALVSIVALTAKLLAGAKEALIGARFGVGDQVDIFLMALLLPLTFTNVVSICLSIAFIPQFAKARGEGPRAGHALYSSVLLIGVCVTIATVVCLYLIGRPILRLLAPSFSEPKIEATVHCFFIILPMLLFTCATNLWSGILNTESRFLIPSLVPILTTAVTAISSLLVNAPGMAPYYLSSSITVGAALECILVGVALKRAGFQMLPAFGRWHSGARTVVHEFVFLSLGNLVVSAIPIINQSLAARLGSGTVAAVNYGAKIPAMFLSVASTAIGTVMLPHFSKLAANGRWRELKQLSRHYMTVVTLALIPVTAVLVWQSRLLVRLMFQRGHFTTMDTMTVSQVQAWYFLQVPFVLPGLIGNRLLMSLQASRFYIVVNVINVGVIALLSPIFVKWLGAPGLGASTSVMSAIATVLVISMAWVKLAERAAIREDKSPVEPVRQ